MFPPGSPPVLLGTVYFLSQSLLFQAQKEGIGFLQVNIICKLKTPPTKMAFDIHPSAKLLDFSTSEHMFFTLHSRVGYLCSLYIT